MLRTHLMFFFPLLCAAIVLARAAIERPRIYIAAAFGSLLLAAVLMYLGVALITPDDGLRHIPTLLGAYFAPVALLAAVLWLLRGRYSLSGRIGVAVVSAAALSTLSVLFLLAAVCIVRSNCL